MSADFISPSAPLHRQVRESLRILIQEQFRHGDRFPGETELMERLSVSQGTVRRALGELVAEGLLIRRVPAGTFVQKDGRPRPIAVILPGWQSFFISAWREALVAVSESRGVEPRFYFTRKHQDMALLGDWLDRGRFQGALLLGNDLSITNQAARLLHGRGIPATSFENTIPTGPTFHLDEDRGMALALGHLADLGHRRITFLVNEPFEADSIRRRTAAFEARCGQMGLRCVTVDGKVPFWTDSHDAAMDLMPRVWADRPTAILCASDAGAFAALKWLRRTGLSLPRDVSVMGYNDDGADRFVDPSLTSVAQPVADMAARFLDSLTRETRPGLVPFEPQLIIRESTAPAP